MKLIGRADARIGLWIILVLVGTALVWSLPSGSEIAYGQEAAPAAAPAEDPAADAEEAVAATDQLLEDEQPLGRIILNSGVFGFGFYFVLLVFSLVAMTVTLERFFRLRRSKVVPPAFVAGLENLVRSKQDTVDNFRTLCTASPSPAARILTAGVNRAGRAFPEVEKSMEDAAARESAKMRGRNRALEVIGAVAPLVGLFGTVVGMIFAFRMASQEGLGKAEVFAQGIYLALLTTAAGLLIAIPCLLLCAWFNSLAEKFLHEIDEALTGTTPCFTRAENVVASGTMVVQKTVPVERTAPVEQKSAAAALTQEPVGVGGEPLCG
jgi:biopolymer transport protein ExbB